MAIHRADPAARRLALYGLLGLLIVGLVLVLAMQQQLATIDGWLQAGEIDRAGARLVLLGKWAFGSISGLGLLVAGLVGRGALQVIREQRYPSSQARLLRDQEITEGAKALRFGWLALTLAFAFALCGIAGAYVGWQMLELTASSL